MVKTLRLPKVQLSIALFLIFLSAFRQLPLQQYLYILITSLGFTIFFDLAISYLRIKKFFIPYAAIATGLIIALTVNPDLSWLQIALISGISMAIKNFVRISNKHIFNPAASGLFFGGLIFYQNVSWWGVSSQHLNNINLQTLLPFIILLFPLYVSAFRVKRYVSILSFVITYLLFSVSTGSDFTSAIKLGIDPTVIFFSIVMLPEPMTSPIDKNRQFFYGVFVALASFVVALPILSNIVVLPDPLIAGLLLGNLIFFKK